LSVQLASKEQWHLLQHGINTRRQKTENVTSCGKERKNSPAEKPQLIIIVSSQFRQFLLHLNRRGNLHELKFILNAPAKILLK
jgi:hypothetical protein